MIEGFIGLPGAGKTLELTRRALRDAERGIPVYSNYPIDHPMVTVVGPRDLSEVRGGTIVLDEVHLWLPARLSMKIPVSWLGMFSQTRKMGWNILWSAQHQDRVDRVLRDITTWMYYCERFGPLFVVKCFEPENFRKKGKDIGFPVIHRLPKKAAAAYDTYGVIVGADHTRDPKDIYAKEALS